MVESVPLADVADKSPEVLLAFSQPWGKAMRRREHGFLPENDLTANEAPLTPPRRSEALQMIHIKYCRSKDATKGSTQP